jgi:FixJ family two-component response regulator
MLKAVHTAISAIIERTERASVTRWQDVSTLTPREREVMALVVRGM